MESFKVDIMISELLNGHSSIQHVFGKELQVIIYFCENLFYCLVDWNLWKRSDVWSSVIQRYWNGLNI